jgi:hypothetical protein
MEQFCFRRAIAIRVKDISKETTAVINYLPIPSLLS